MRPITTSRFDLFRERVEAMTSDGASLPRIEEMLRRAQLPADTKDALWVLAWTLLQRAEEGGRASVRHAPLGRRRPLTFVTGGE